MLSSSIPSLNAIIDKKFGDLNLIQLNWKPAPDQWSIGQCLDHLIVSNGKYLPVLLTIIEGKNKPSFWEKNNPLSNYTGKQMIKTLGKNVVKKYKSPRLFIPSESTINQNIVSDFKNHQYEIFQLFLELEKEKYKHIVVTSPVASLITLKLHDLIELIIVHEERHINQALRVKNNINFPN